MLRVEDVEVFEEAGDLDEDVDDEVFWGFGRRFPGDRPPVWVAQGRPLPRLYEDGRLTAPMGRSQSRFTKLEREGGLMRYWRDLQDAVFRQQIADACTPRRRFGAAGS